MSNKKIYIYEAIFVGKNDKEFLIYGYAPLLQNDPVKSSISTKEKKSNQIFFLKKKTTYVTKQTILLNY
jgi:hypothetical protein